MAIGKLLIGSAKVAKQGLKAYAKRKKRISRTGFEAQQFKRLKSGAGKGWKGIKGLSGKLKQQGLTKGKQSLLFTGKKLKQGFQLASKHSQPLRQYGAKKLQIGSRFAQRYGTRKALTSGAGRLFGKVAAPVASAIDYKSLINEGYTRKEAAIIAGSGLAGWTAGAAVGAGATGAIGSAFLATGADLAAREVARRSLGVSEQDLSMRLKIRAAKEAQNSDVQRNEEKDNGS